MRKLSFVCVAGLSLVLGCENKEASKSAQPAPTAASPSSSAAARSSAPAPEKMTTEAQSAAGTATAGARSGVDTAVDRTSGAAADVQAQGAAAAQSAGAATQTPGATAQPAGATAQTPGAAAPTQGAATGDLTPDQAKTMLDQAMQYVKQNKYDLAEKSLNQVEAHKASLPKTLQDQIGTVRTALTTAKAGGGLQIPGLGGGSSAK